MVYEAESQQPQLRAPDQSGSQLHQRWLTLACSWGRGERRLGGVGPGNPSRLPNTAVLFVSLSSQSLDGAAGEALTRAGKLETNFHPRRACM